VQEKTKGASAKRNEGTNIAKTKVLFVVLPSIFSHRVFAADCERSSTNERPNNALEFRLQAASLRNQNA